ncbi:alpha/beta hydrolase domain-containing protein [Pseudomonas profundi]|uniref:alpha/beta hydrolase domain-containing protein n=1 Tax=Pseudomonas profundi TaxID=1981513 RepID=UPI001CC23F5E|nr:alpha/beta hydrolase domain-containing protein [Pseudomonas profundi]
MIRERIASPHDGTQSARISFPLLAGLALGLSWSASLLAAPAVDGPIPGSPPGDPLAAEVENTYPFFATRDALARRGYVEEEFYLSGTATGYSVEGEQLAEDVPYRTRIVVRRPKPPRKFNGTVVMEWQNVTAGYDLDALWHGEQLMRAGFAWVGVSAQRVGVNHLREWSPTRYGELDVTGGGSYNTDELSYDIFAQAAEAVRQPADIDPMGGLDVEKVLAVGGSQSAGRMTIYYDNILPQVENPVFDGYNFVVGTGPSRAGTEPVFHVLSETDVRTPEGRRPDSDVYRRWEVAGAAHSGYQGQAYRAPLSERDLPDGAPEYECVAEPFSRIPLHHVVVAAHDHLVDWIDGKAPPSAPYLEFEGTTKVRNELGLAQGGIQLSQLAVPTAINTGDNAGQTFCFLFGSYEPLDEAQLKELYRNHGTYVAKVTKAAGSNVSDGYVLPADGLLTIREAAKSDVGKGRRKH